MKNATKLVWLVMLFASSIVFAFGQTNANMSLEQKIAYDNSVVAKSGGGIDLSVPSQNRAVKAILINETFDSALPGTWTQMQYSGVGLWQHVPSQSNGFASYVPPNSDGNYAVADSDGNGTDFFDVGLMTPSLDMSAAAGPDVTIDLDRNLQDFAGYGLGEVRVYSTACYHYGFMLMVIFAVISLAAAFRIRETGCRNIYGE